jgi:protein AFG1
MLCRQCARFSSVAGPRYNATTSRMVQLRIQRAASTSTAIQITDPILLYENLVRSGRIQRDENQLRLLYQLRKIHDVLMDYKPSYSLRFLLESARPETSSSTASGRFDDRDITSLSARILPSKVTKDLVRSLSHEDDLSNLDTPEGFLLTGSVGTGKTMLLDLFYDSLPIKKKRIHYHAFLLGLYRQVFVALEEQRIAADNEEREMQSLAGLDGRGYPWSRKEENKAKALTRGWRQVGHRQLEHCHWDCISNLFIQRSSLADVAMMIPRSLRSMCSPKLP